MPLRADACKIEFALHYEFSNIILEKIIGPVFRHIANTFVESFVKRADQRYGKHEHDSSVEVCYALPEGQTLYRARIAATARRCARRSPRAACSSAIRRSI